MVAQRSKEEGILVKFGGTTMQRASVLCSTFRIDWRNRSEYFLVFNAPNFTECFYFVYIVLTASPLILERDMLVIQA